MSRESRSVACAEWGRCGGESFWGSRGGTFGQTPFFGAGHSGLRHRHSKNKAIRLDPFAAGCVEAELVTHLSARIGKLNHAAIGQKIIALADRQHVFPPRRGENGAQTI